MIKKKQKGRKKKHLNLLVVSDPSSSPTSFKIPVWAIKAIIVFSLVIGITGTTASVYFAGQYNKLQSESEKLDEVTHINEVQKEKISKLEDKAAEVEDKIENLDQLDKQVRDKVGLNSRTSDSSEEDSDTRSEVGSRGGGVGPPKGSSINEEDLNEDLNNNEEDLNNYKNSKSNEEALDESTLFDSKEQEEEYDNIRKLEHLNEKYLSQAETLDKKDEELSELKVKVEERLAFLEALPSSWPTKGRITSVFGRRSSPFNNRVSEFHDGLDIANSYGTTIYAAGKGTVVSAGWKSGYGETIEINHGYGYKSYYAHCSKFLVSPGEQVEKGQAIAEMGSTGRSTGCHLHFGVSHQGRMINPYETLS